MRYSSNGEHLGDIYVLPSGLIWCPGKTPRDSGTFTTWEVFDRLMRDYQASEPHESQPPL